MVNNVLVHKYEAGGSPSTVSTGSGDLGGVSYGIYQLASKTGSVDSFVSWLVNYPEDCYANYGRVLSQHQVNSEGFIAQWKDLGDIDPVGFGRLQDEYAVEQYYNPAVKRLKAAYFNIECHSDAMQAVLFSRAIQYGSGNMVELFTIAAKRLGFDNLSYVDAYFFDSAMITEIYTFLQEECLAATLGNDGLYHSPNDWANGSESVVKGGLMSRFINELADALALLPDASYYVKQFSKYFTPEEMGCKCGCGLPKGFSKSLLNVLDKVRDTVGKPVHVTSGYRCPTHNANVGGASRSRHTEADAADIYVEGMGIDELADICINCGADGIGRSYAGGFVHVDMRGERVDFLY